MHYFIALAHKEEGSSFGVSFPDVPGVYSAADDMDDLVPNAAEALSLYAEDGPLPPPPASMRSAWIPGSPRNLRRELFWWLSRSLKMMRSSFVST